MGTPSKTEDNSPTPETDVFEAAQHPSCRFADVLEKMRKLERERNAAQSGNRTLADERDELRRTNEGLLLTFSLRWNADQRAIKHWQATHPGNDFTWPDHTDMVVWLMDQLSSKNAIAMADADTNLNQNQEPK